MHAFFIYLFCLLLIFPSSGFAALARNAAWFALQHYAPLENQELQPEKLSVNATWNNQRYELDWKQKDSMHHMRISLQVSKSKQFTSSSP